MLVTLAAMLLICAILVAMGYTGEESLLIYWLYIVLGSVAFLCVYPGLYALIRLPRIIKLFKRIKELGYDIKLDTNGSFPERLCEALKSGMIDYVAMDIKNSKEKYWKSFENTGKRSTSSPANEHLVSLRHFSRSFLFLRLGICIGIPPAKTER